MIDYLKIENYRGISHLEIDRMSTVNIFVGKNGVGKTTTLEAIALIVGTRRNMFQYLGFQRGLKHPTVLVSTLFKNQSQDSLPKITGMDRVIDLTHTLNISPLDYDKAQEMISGHVFDDDQPNRDNYHEEDIPGVTFSYTGSDDSKIDSNHAIHSNHFHDSSQKNRKKKGGVFYIGSRVFSSDEETAKMLSRIQNTPDLEEELYSSLRKIEPKLTRLRTSYVNKNMIELVADLETSRGIPIKVLGDGFCRLALILTGLYSNKTSTVIIDDVDSGIHHEIMASMWEVITSVSKKLDKQVFCVTHNDEMLSATLAGFKNKKDALKIYRIYEEDNKHHVQAYDYNLLVDSNEFGLPIR